MVVRDPWRRAVSAFHEDNGYQGWLNLSSSEGEGEGDGDLHAPSTQTRRETMLEYLSHPERYNHAMPASSFCNLKEGLRFDHYFDIDSGLSNLADIFATTNPTPPATAVPREYLTTGWESCTEGNAPSILEARLKTSHTWRESRQQLDEIYCTPALVRQAIRHFREDYLLLGELAGFSALPSCLSLHDQLSLLAGDDLDDELVTVNVTQ